MRSIVPMLFLVASCNGGCGPLFTTPDGREMSSVHKQKIAAEAIAVAFNAAEPIIVRAATEDTSPDADERWRAVGEAHTAFRLAHGAYASELEAGVDPTEKTLLQYAESYCGFYRTLPEESRDDLRIPMFAEVCGTKDGGL